ncbi:hypothetical protein CAC42_3744 [Sphaceloma murrayae]|uniref:Uncharacterized protein n=1 Tax=Sphaceloma murrayae TaxID=2082308 RepID=A0A2K1QH24_9PEZI|nr:hypothetical protein CAC42_3744 [Sphaceloma murrayae]
MDESTTKAPGVDRQQALDDACPRPMAELVPGAGLLSLPDELLDSIFALFLDDPYSAAHLWSLPLRFPDPSEQVRNSTSARRPNFGRYTLWSLSLVCRRLHRLATPQLYHTFATSTAMWYPTTNRIPLRTCKFIVSLLLKPALVQHLKRLILHPLASSFWAHESPFFPSQPPDYAAQWRRLEAGPVIDNAAQLGLGTSQLTSAFRIRLHSASRTDGFIADRIRGYEPIEAQLLLALAPRLETLVWSDWRSEAGPEVAGMFRWVNAHSLKTLIANYSYDLETLGQWGHLTRFSKIDKICVICGCERSPPPLPGGRSVGLFKSARQAILHGRRGIDALSLAFPCTTGLVSLLSPCTALRSLHIRLDVDFRMRDISQSWGRVSGSWTEVIASLTSNPRLIETIEDLTLDSEVKNREDWTMTTDNWPLHVETLHGFRTLRRLAIHQSAFLSFEATSSFPTVRKRIGDVVPATVERVRILCFDAGLLNQMDEFVGSLPGLCPELKRVEVRMGDFCCFDVNRTYPPHNLVRSSEDHLETLYGEFGKRGIEFVEIA